MLADYASNRFARPSAADPVALARFDVAAFAALPAGFEAIELSPVAPLGTASALATVHQNKALASIRSVEVLSDATNVLALECALRRKALLRADAKSSQAVQLAASHRHLRDAGAAARAAVLRALRSLHPVQRGARHARRALPPERARRAPALLRADRARVAGAAGSRCGSR